MAAVSDCFSVGSTVWCRTCYNQEIEGDVLAFDPQTKILILKCPPSSGMQTLGLHDVNFVNLSLVSELKVKKEVMPTVVENPPSLNLQRLNTRIKNQVDEKRRLLTTMSSSVSPEGQKLFLAISKTIKEVKWRNSDIVVWDQQVVITPPYQLDDIKGSVESKEYGYIKKVVEKHMKDTALSNSNRQHSIPQQQNATSP